MPYEELTIIPREVFVYKDVVDCVGSGQPTGEEMPHRVYFAINETSGRLMATEVAKLSVHLHVNKHFKCSNTFCSLISMNLHLYIHIVIIQFVVCYQSHASVKRYDNINEEH